MLVLLWLVLRSSIGSFDMDLILRSIGAVVIVIIGAVVWVCELFGKIWEKCK